MIASPCSPFHPSPGEGLSRDHHVVHQHAGGHCAHLVGSSANTDSNEEIASASTASKTCSISEFLGKVQFHPKPLSSQIDFDERRRGGGKNNIVRVCVKTSLAEGW